MPRVKCLDKWKSEYPEVHSYLRDKSGIDFNGVEGKEKYLAAAKELQQNSLDNINDVYTQIGVKGFSKKQSQASITEEAAENVVPSTLKDVESFETSKGSVYTVGEDGKTSRFKTKTGEQNEPQDLTVFAKFEGQQGDDYLQALHGTNGESVSVAGIIDGKVQQIETNADAAKAENIKLIIVDKDGKIIQKIDAVTTPTIGYSVYDQRNLGDNKRQKHIGNEVSKINPKQQTSPTNESNQNKTKVNNVLKDNAALSDIGTATEYSSYLSSIFPESKVRDILIRANDKKYDDLKESRYGSLGKGYYFTDQGFEGFGNNNQYVIINTTNPFNITDEQRVKIYEEENYDPNDKNFDENININRIQNKEGYDSIIPDYGGEFVVFNRDQIHLLGSQEDIQGFKNWKSQQATPTTEKPKVRVTADQLESSQPTKNEKAETTRDTVETEATVTDDTTATETGEAAESGEGNKPPTETVDTGKEEGDNKERRQFSEQVLSDKKILPQVKKGVQNAIEYTRQTNRMSVEEAEEILSRVKEDEAFALVTLNDELKPAVRVVLGQVLIRRYNQLAKEAKGTNFEDYYLDKTIDVANYVSEKLGTEAGQMVQAFSLWSRLTPEAQLRSASKEKREQGKKQVDKVKNDINVVGDKLQQANEEAAEEVVNSKKKKASVAKVENQKVKKAKDKVQAAKDKRGKLIEQRKKDKGKGGALFSSVGGLTPEGIEFVGNVAATYIQEGVARVEIIVQRINEHLKEISGKDPDAGVMKNVGDIVNELVLKDQNKKIISGLSDMEKEVGRIVKEHYTVPAESKTSLVNKFMDNLDLDKADAELLAKEIQTEFDTIVKRKKDNILYTEKARFDRIQKKLDPKKEKRGIHDDVVKYSNLGAFDNNEFADFLAKKLDVGKLSTQEAREITNLSEKIQKAPEGSPKNDATQQLLAYRANMKGISWLETAQAIWYANILSGYATHLRNIVSTFFNGMAYFGAEAARDPRSIPVLVYGGARGLNRGMREAWHTLSTGKSPIHISKVETPGTLERQRFIGGFFNPYNYLKFVGRLMVAEDVLQFQALKEMRATQLAYREAKKMGSKNPFSKKTWDLIDEKLLNTKERTELAFEQAKDEGYTEKSVERKRRVYELMENSRPIQMTEDAYGFAARGTFNFEPEGTLGAITNAIGGALNTEIAGVRPLRFFVPFTRIITNVVNNSLDFGPWGLLRVARGGSVISGTKFRQLTTEQKNQLIARASLGIGLTGAIYALTKVPCKDGHNVLDITGGGTGDFQKDAQLKETGWQPFSIRACGGSYYSYKYTPLIFNLSVIGFFNDREKYGKEVPRMEAIMGAMYQTGQLALDGTWVGSTSDLMKSIAESSPAQLGKNVEKSVKDMALQLTLPNAYVQGAQTIEEWMNLPKKEAKTFYERLVQHIPVVRNSLNDKLNSLGEPILTDVDIFKSERKPHKVYDFLIEKKQWVAPVNKNSIPVWDSEQQIERPITDDEYYNFSKRRGQLIKEKTEHLIDDGVTETTADGEQQIAAQDLNAKQLKRIMRKIKTESSKQAKLEMFDKKEKESSKYKIEINDTDEEEQ